MGNDTMIFKNADDLINYLDALYDQDGQGGEKWMPAQAAIQGIREYQETSWYCHGPVEDEPTATLRTLPSVFIAQDGIALAQEVRRAYQDSGEFKTSYQMATALLESLGVESEGFE